jgi:hypothetical protein
VPITKLKNLMDYNENILNEVEEGDEWSEETPETPEVPGTEETEIDTEDWASEDEEV